MMFTLGFWTLLPRARVSGKRLPQYVGVSPRLLLEEFQSSLGDSARAVRTWRGGWGGALVMRQPADALRRISFPLRSRCLHLESGALFPLTLYLAVLFQSVWVLLLSLEGLDFAGDSCFVGAILGSTVDTRSATVLWWLWTNFTHFCVGADSNADVLLSLLLQNGEACPVDASGCSWKPESPSYVLHVAETRDDGQHFFFGCTCVRHRCLGAGSTRESDSRLAGSHAN